MKCCKSLIVLLICIQYFACDSNGSNIINENTPRMSANINNRTWQTTNVEVVTDTLFCKITASSGSGKSFKYCQIFIPVFADTNTQVLTDKLAKGYATALFGHGTGSHQSSTTNRDETGVVSIVQYDSLYIEGKFEFQVNDLDDGGIFNILDGYFLVKNMK